MIDKDKNELDKISLKYFKTDLVKIHKLDFDKELTLLNALSYCLISNYKLLTEEQKKEYIEKQFITQIIRDLKKRKGIDKYITPTCALDKSAISKDFKYKKFNDSHIKFLSIFFNINIFVIKENVNTAKTGTNEQYITVLYTRNKTFNIFKHSIILFFDKNNQLYYPLSINNQTIFIYTKDELFKKYLDNNVIFVEQYNDKELIYDTLSKKYDEDIENIEENKNNMLNKNKDKDNTNSITNSITSISSTTSKEQSNLNVINDKIISKQIINDDKNNEEQLINDEQVINDDENINEEINNEDENNEEENNENEEEIINDEVINNDEIIYEEQEEQNEEENNSNSNSIEEIPIQENNVIINVKTPIITDENIENNTESITTEQAIKNVLEPQRINKYSKDELEQLPVVELKKLLKQNKIKQSYRDEEGKIKQKTRNLIINDLLSLRQ